MSGRGTAAHLPVDLAEYSRPYGLRSRGLVGAGFSTPIELWDGTGGDPAADLAAQPDWSLYEVGDLSPIAIVASFFGNRTGHNPMRAIGYVL